MGLRLHKDGMKKKIDVDSWSRKSHYEYFQTFDCPMFSITFPVRVDALYRYARENGLSFSPCACLCC